MDNHFTIPTRAYEIEPEESLIFIPDMNGPFSSFAFCHKTLANILLPFCIFSSRLRRCLDTKSAEKIAKQHQSLAWALRAYCHANGLSFRCTPDGELTEIAMSNNDYETNSPITRVQFMNAGGWAMIRLNALVFDWDKVDILKSFYSKGIYLEVSRNDDNSPTGYVDLVSLPVIDYTETIVEQIEDHIHKLNRIAYELIKHYNLNK